MKAALAKAPSIIVRRAAPEEDSHGHGGAWKVAYADFVTAMMAFFLLMWLLNATTEEQRKGIADYFDPTIPISRTSAAGSNALYGEARETRQELVSMPTPPPPPVPPGLSESDILDAFDAALEAAFEKTTETLNGREAESHAPIDLRRRVVTRQTPEGPVIELIDDDDAPLFAIGSAEPSAVLIALSQAIADALADFPQPLAIEGHTDSRQYADFSVYTNWELSTDRAHAARRLLAARGIPDNRIAGISGKADKRLYTDNPLAAQNRRIAITLLAAPESDAANGLAPPLR